jgi:hypothetical protein
MTTETEQLHACWCSCTGQDLHQRATERLFYEFHSIGFTSADLKLVLEYLLKQNRQMNGAKFRINCVKIVGDHEAFASLLGEAAAVKRNRVVVTAKDVALKQLRPSVGTDLTGNAARNVAEVFQAMRQGCSKDAPSITP